MDNVQDMALVGYTDDADENTDYNGNEYQMEVAKVQDEGNDEQQAIQLVSEAVYTKQHSEPRSLLLRDKSDKLPEEKSKQKKIKFNFELRETTPQNSESDTDDLDPENDGLLDPSIDRKPIKVPVYEEDDEGNLVENRRKSYVLTPVDERIGCLINIDEKYYSRSALDQFEINKEKLLKYTKELKKKKKAGEDGPAPENPLALKPQAQTSGTAANPWKGTLALMKKNTSIRSKLDGDDDLLKDRKLEAAKGFENARDADEPVNSDDESLYLTPNGKFDVLNKYFGISSLPLPPCAGNQRKMKKAIKHLKKIGALISGDYERLWQVITALENQTQKGKKVSKDAERFLVPLLSEKVFFKKKVPMSREQLLEVCCSAKYQVMNPGQTVYRQGDLADKCYLILKGEVSVQIPDPTGQGLVVPKKPEEDAQAEEQQEKEDPKGKELTPEELEALPPREQRQYKTRVMLQEILSCQNVERSTQSLSQAINASSSVADRVKLAPAEPKQFVRQFTENIKSGVTAALQSSETGQQKNIVQVIAEQRAAEQAAQEGGTWITDVPGQNNDQDENSPEKDDPATENSPLPVVPAEQQQALRLPYEDTHGILDPGEPINVRDLYEVGMLDIARLEGGGSFGELALLDGKPRAATIKCTQRTHFMTISIDDYDKALKQIKRNELEEKMTFMKNKVPLFMASRPNPTALRRLAGEFKKQTCTRDALLIQEGQPARFVYIVREGEFLLTRKVYSKDVQTEDVLKIKEDPKKAREVQSKFNRKNNKRKIDYYEIGQVNRGALIGEDDVRLGHEVYSTTAKCLSQEASLLVVSAEDFVQKLQNSPATWNLLSTYVKDKQKQQTAHMKNTNQWRERISANTASPALKKGEEINTSPSDGSNKLETRDTYEMQVKSKQPSFSGDSKRASVDVGKKKDIKSTGNFSTASNEDYQDIASASAKTAYKIQARGFKNPNKTALEGPLKSLDTQYARLGLQTSPGEARQTGAADGPLNFNFGRGAMGFNTEPINAGDAAAKLSRRKTMWASGGIGKFNMPNIHSRGNRAEVSEKSVTEAAWNIPATIKTRPVASLFQSKGTQLYRRGTTLSYALSGPDGLHHRQALKSNVKSSGLASSQNSGRLPTTMQNSMTRIGINSAAGSRPGGKQGFRQNNYM